MWENQPWSLSTVTWVAYKLPWARPKIWMRASELRWSGRLRACPKPGGVYWYLSSRKELLKISWLNLNLQKYCIISQLVRVSFCFSTIIMSLLCFLLDSQSRGMVVISTLCHYCLLICVSCPLNDNRLIEERVFLSCYPCVTNSAQRALRPHPIPVLDTQRGPHLISISTQEIQALTSWVSFSFSK